ncbi:methylmalonyl-CoA epimerase [Prosthecochloris sp. N3]|uniref:Methylmalonyl-CoA epimerase n=1 Tax=Prosthecochloris ethylica TaxID=2743976 RepID=A0ABR9XSH6_9CHLB|nr:MULTISPECIES: methylmalonyl-CoA epimerase [Prosthecochloris]MBF0586711.1 methylmalonyl-CoA epimerase [Prosthecochloris ethylica]MBF0636935.1 methylmalonyl-CoA epimerase [Prosthecochloris ethylica]NUK47806.1 methylmalonyl-CoA epimerase [Prosthecochloris ethylica]RNA65053.1 methylmalonyl-CoA epimerase [Prosthecochloris sp. ZM_2]
MIKSIDHIAIAVSDLDKAVERYTALIGTTPDAARIEEVPSEHVRVAFLSIGGTKIELLEPLNSDGPIARFLEKKGEGLHHIALETEDLEEETRRTAGEGIIPISEPSTGANNKKVVFFNPKDTNRVLIEFVQKL